MPLTSLTIGSLSVDDRIPPYRLSLFSRLDSELIAVLVLTLAELRAMVRDRPKGFGDQPDKCDSDAVFLMGIDAPMAMEVFDPRPGVDGRGTSLTSVPPVRPIGMGKDTRGVDLESLEDLDDQQAASWMRQAAAIPRFGQR